MQSIRVVAIACVIVLQGCDGNGTSETPKGTEPPKCGDGVIDTGETCDDGSANSDTGADACRTNCTAARCGDNVKDSAETCDDGNSDDSDACTSVCDPRGRALLLGQ